MNSNDVRKPGMPKGDWKFIQSYLKPTFTMFEWGSGGSTTYFSYFVDTYISIEHDKHWFEHTVSNIQKEKRKNVVLYLVPAPNKDYKKYTNQILDTECKGMYFDAVLIDGRNRVECAIKILDYIDENSLVFLHDSDRARYSEIYNYYERIGTTFTCDLLRKKKNGENR